ncbi:MULTISPECIES: carbohydrate ABC transporter permease [Kineococcus]|uniref:carbohydrate ABC transporter permease n=1 Tax=unclassified Kineococcus TaxID=2621656 RepID=UPI001F5A2B21|nr:carbohydrate ABC transporter permease [Kineococcus sp. TRM81007]MCI2237093.1 carbohydrate ABC transporter permease [Kineococcus sp. TRM81007]MCI3926437.1 carbohydrate ABC transporter permease [Paenibacillus sp. TRM 82003]
MTTTTPATSSRPVSAPPRTSLARRAAHRAPWWIAVLFLAGVAVLWVYPFVWMVSASLKSSMEVFTAGLTLIPEDFAWENYSRAWTDAGFGRYMINTVIVTLATVAIVVVRCALCGYVLGRYSFRGSKLIIGILIATLFVPTGYTIIPVVKLSMELGLLNSLTGMVLALAGASNVSAILIYAGYFRQLPKELEEAAVVDGAGFLRVFFRIMLPLSMPVTATVGLLTFLFTWNAFFLPLVFSFSRPELRTLSVGMQAFVGENATDWSGMAAAGVVSILPIVALFLFLQRFFVEGIAGAVKS